MKATRFFTLNSGFKVSHISLTLAASILIVTIALAAVGSLWALFHLYERYVHSMAMSGALQHGALLANSLGQEKFLQAESISKADAEQFQRLISSIRSFDQHLEYVTVQEQGLTLYHWQAPLHSQPRTSANPEQGKIAAVPKRLHLGSGTEDIIEFSLVLKEQEGGRRSLKLGLRKDSLLQISQNSMPALASMFRFVLSMVVLAFLLCLFLVLLLIWRELRWLKHRRNEEHLAFAGAMAGSVIHDFRNPMSAMHLDAQMIACETAKDEADKAKLHEWSQRITRTLGRMDDVLKEFLELSSPERAEAVAFDVGAAVLDCADLFKTRFERANVRLEVFSASEDLQTKGYPTQFKRALLNVLNNACQFSPPAGKVVLRAVKSGRHIEISIEDDGPGIPPAERSRVFEMFYSRRPGGSGIGLALARTAVIRCGGEIFVADSREQSGCLTIIRLPLKP